MDKRAVAHKAGVWGRGGEGDISEIRFQNTSTLLRPRCNTEILARNSGENEKKAIHHLTRFQFYRNDVTTSGYDHKKGHLSVPCPPSATKRSEMKSDLLLKMVGVIPARSKTAQLDIGLGERFA